MPAKKKIPKARLSRPARGQAAEWLPEGVEADVSASGVGAAAAVASAADVVGSRVAGASASVPPSPPRAGLLAALEAAEEQELQEAERILMAGGKVKDALRRKLRAREVARAQQQDARRGASAPESMEDRAKRAAADLNVFWVNGDAKFQVRTEEGLWIEVNEKRLGDMLTERGIPPYPVEGNMLEPQAAALLHVTRRRSLDYAVRALAGYNSGVHAVKDAQILVRKGPRLIEPVEGDFSLIDQMISGRLLGLEREGLVLDTPEAKRRALSEQQRPVWHFHGWMQRAVENLYGDWGSNLVGQVMVLAGAQGAAKSRLQHMIITPCLGGRSADPSSYVFGDTDFNEEWMGAEHLLIEDPRPSFKFLDKVRLAQVFKSLVVNDDQRFHPKHRSAITVEPKFRLSVSVNDDPDSLRVLPNLTPDFRDKVMLLKVQSRPLPMAADTPAEKRLFREAVSAQIPAYLWHLLNEFKLPEWMGSGRYGVAEYHDPDLAMLLWEDTPASEFLALIDAAIVVSDGFRGLDEQRPLFRLHAGAVVAEYGVQPKTDAGRFLAAAEAADRRVWCGTYQELTEEVERSQHSRSARKITDHNAVQRLLGRLERDRPDRVLSYRRGERRLWLIVAPESTPELSF